MDGITVMHSENIEPFCQSFIYQSGFLSDMLRDLSVQEYVFLSNFEAVAKETPFDDQRVYLQDMANRLGLEIRKASTIAKALKEKGLIRWQHDGTGTDGTYLIMTEQGAGVLFKQESFLKHCYVGILSAFGEDRLHLLVSLWEELEGVIMDNIDKDCA